MCIITCIWATGLSISLDFFFTEGLPLICFMILCPGFRGFSRYLQIFQDCISSLRVNIELPVLQFFKMMASTLPKSARLSSTRCVGSIPLMVKYLGGGKIGLAIGVTRLGDF